MGNVVAYGYARVSSRDQNLARQLLALEEYPVALQHIYTDKASGRDFDREGYHQLLRVLNSGDLVVIKSIDRLGRNYDEIQEQWRYLTSVKDVDVVVLDMPLLDTRQGVAGVTGKFISDMVLRVLSYVAHIERESIHQRQREGIIAAKERGVKFGRPHKEVPDGFEDVLHDYWDGNLTRSQAAKKLGVCERTFDAWRKRHREGEM